MAANAQLFRLTIRLQILLPFYTLLAPSNLFADATVTTSFTQSGGTYTLSPAGLLTINGSGSPLFSLINGAGTSGVQSLDVGDSQTGLLLVSSNSVFSNTGVAWVGYSAGSSGTVTVTGTGSQWNNGSYTYMGVNGSGTLNVQSGGVVSSGITSYLGVTASGVGTATVTGSGSQWNSAGALVVGDSGHGTLSVLNGGKATADGGILIGREAIAVGTATVDGSSGGISSQLNTISDLYVGSAGTGTLNVQAGGHVTNVQAFVGYYAGSSGTVAVTGSGSQWNSSSYLYIGASGNGTLNVTDGGVVNGAHNSYLGVLASGVGTATVTGAGSQWNSVGALVVGDSGHGTLNILDGGKATADGGILIGREAIAVGTATVDGSSGGISSQLNTSDDLYVGYSGNGTLNVQAGGHVTNAWASVGAYAGSSGTVAVTGPGSLWASDGSVYLGSNGTGTLNVQSGGVVSSGISSYLGVTASGVGTATVTGSGSQWNSAGALVVGDSGHGTLNILNGGKATAGTSDVLIGREANAVGTATVDGSSGGIRSQLNTSGTLRVGEGGTGTLNIQAGATVAALRSLLGDYTGSQGTATISGTGSQWTSTEKLTVGNSGTGTLNIQAGAHVTTYLGIVGNEGNSHGTVVVSGPGSNWRSESTTDIGYTGNGIVRIEAGATGSSLEVEIAAIPQTFSSHVEHDWRYEKTGTIYRFFSSYDVYGYVDHPRTVETASPLSTGSLVVTGIGSQWTTTNGLYVGGTSTGYGGVGTLNVDSSGTVTVGGTLKLWNQGTLTLDTGGSITAQSFDRSVGTFNFRDGTLTVNGGAYAQASTTNGAANILTLNGNSPTAAPTLKLVGTGATTGVQAVVVGDTNRGVLEISGGRVLNSNFSGVNVSIGDVAGGNVLGGFAYLGMDTAASGTATVTGAGSQWNNSGSMYVGGSGTGTLNVQAGGVVSSGISSYLGVAASATGTATVTGAGSQWNSAGALVVGDSGHGTLSVLNGGTANAAGTLIGVEAGSVGVVNVNGTGSTFNSAGSVYIGGNNLAGGGTGTLSITNGGAVNVGGLTRIWQGQGSVTIGAGSALTTDSLLGGNVTNDGVLTLGVANASFNYAGVIIGSGSVTKSGTGNVAFTGANTYTGSTSVQGGVLRVATYGGSGMTGNLNISGGVLESSGEFTRSQGTGAGQVQWGGSGGFSAQGANLTVNMGGAATPLTWGSNLFVPVNASLIFGSTTADAQTTFAHPINFNGGVRTIVVNDNASSSADRALLTGALSNGGLLKTGVGVLVLTGVNTYTSGTTVAAGTLQIGDGGVAGSIGGDILNNATLAFNRSDAYTFSGAVTGTGGVAQIGVGTTILSASNNNYSGITTVQSGVLQGTASTSLGIGGVVLNGGELIIPSFDRSARSLTHNDGTLTVSGGAYLHASGSNTSANTLTINGNTAGANPTLKLQGNGAVSGVEGIVVGSTNQGTLEISAGRVLSSNNDGGVLGFGSGSSGTVTVTGTGSQWNNSSSSSMYVGAYGTGTLNVQSGGVVTNGISGYLGVWAGSTGTATVSGSGSQWNNVGALVVGDSGNGTLNVNSGGKATADGGVLIGREAGSSGNVTVNGTGGGISSQLNSSNNLFVGNSGTGSLNVQGGGRVTNAVGYLGYGGSSSGTATVTGTGSQWNNSSDVYIGNSGSGTLLVQAGGQVTNSIAVVGFNSGSVGTVTVDGVGSQWNSNEYAYFGFEGNATLNVTNGGVVTGLHNNYLGVLANGTATATISGAGSRWSSDGATVVGDAGRGTLNVLGGGVVTSNGGVLIGLDAGSVGTATVSGAGSQWNSSGDFYVGKIGTGNLNVQGGAHVSSYLGLVGSEESGIGTVIVNGQDSSWTNTTAVFIGKSGHGTVRIEAGASGSSDEIIIAASPGHPFSYPVPYSYRGIIRYDTDWRGTYPVYGAITGYRTVEGVGGIADGDLMVTGTGSKWTTSNGLYVGGTSSSSGGTGRLTVTGGGMLNVGGTLKLWGPGTLTIGNGGSITARSFDHGVGTLNFNDGTLTVNGGTYARAAGPLTIDGSTTGALPELRLINGATTTGVTDIKVGINNQGLLTVSGGSVATNGGVGFIGYNGGSSGTATISGTGSQWNSSGDLFVGNSGTGSLNVQGGGRVTNAVGYLGYGGSSSGTATVTGTGSQWNNSSDVYIGNSGSGTLLVQAGGQVTNSIAVVGFNSGSVGTVTVDGVGSQWNSNEYAYFGFEGNATLNVTNGGVVTGLHNNYLGVLANGTATATISGAGSRWSSDGATVVGDAGRGTLNINSGGKATADGGVLIGREVGSSGNVTVNGTGSTFNSAGSVYIGGNNLAAGGLGSMSVVSSSSATVGGTLKLWNQGTLTLGTGGSITTQSFDRTLGTFNFTGGTLTVNGGTFAYLNVLGDLTIDGANNPTLVLNNAAVTSGLTQTYFNVGTVSGHSGTISVLGGSTLTTADISYLGLASGSTGNATVAGTGSTWNKNDGDLYLGYSGSGTLIVSEGGAVTSGSGRLGFNSGSTGTATIAGPNSQWNLGNALLAVGNFGSGTLTVSGGGTVMSGDGFLGIRSGAIGDVTVTGVGSTWTSSGGVYVGGRNSAGGGTGLLTIGSGGQVVVGDTLKLWNNGTLNLSSGGSVTAHSFDRSLGTFNFSGGTLTVSGGTYTQPSGSLTIDGANTPTFVLNNAAVTSGVNGAYVGTVSGHAGVLSVLGGSTLTSNADSFLGYVSGSTGTATITGTGSTWNLSQSLYIGGNSSGPGGYGTLTIGSGGKVVVGDTLKLWNNGTLNLNSGGTLQVAHLDVSLGHFNVAAGSSLIADNSNGGGTSLTVSNNQVVNNSGTIAIPFTLDTGGQVANTGTISSTVTVGANSQVTNSGTISGLVVVNSTATVTNSNAGTVSGPVNVSGANATYINNGSTSGTTTVSSGGVVKGNGTFGTVIINAGGIGSPGNSPETMTDTSTTWSGGGKYVWEINDPADGPGQNPGWDLWNLGTLTLNVASSSNPFLVELRSVGTGVNSNTLTSLSGWNPAQSYSWKIATADSDVFTNAVLNSLLAIDSSSPFFGSNGTSSSFFHLASSNGGMELDLEYDPAAVPEPSSMLLAGMVALPVAWRKIRRRKQGANRRGSTTC